MTAADTPASMTFDPWDGKVWTRLPIPEKILTRTWEAQRGWVSWRVRRHFEEAKGERMTGGKITGYIWSPIRDAAILFDLRGSVDQASFRAFLHDVRIRR